MREGKREKENFGKTSLIGESVCEAAICLHVNPGDRVSKIIMEEESVNRIIVLFNYRLVIQLQEDEYL